jgi:hypothetical protein
MRPTLPIPLLVLSALVPVAVAQATKPMPSFAEVAEGHQGTSLPFGIPGFRTQLLLDAASVGPTGALLTGIRFRADRSSLPATATSVPNVTVTVSSSTSQLGNMSPTFAQNVTGTPTVVFQGTVNLPGYGSAFAGALPWDIAIPFPQPYLYDGTIGNLLIDIVGNNPPAQAAAYWLDAVQRGGAATTYGQAGDNPSFDFLNLNVSTGNSLEPTLLIPGASIDFNSGLMFTSPPGVLVLGILGLPIPIDLGLLGAPTHSLYVDPLVITTHSWTQSFIGWYSTFSLAVPNNPLLADVVIYGQSALFDATANALGLLTSAAVEVRLGNPQLQTGMQQLDADDPSAAIGTLLDFGFGQPQFGATPVLLEGLFF